MSISKRIKLKKKNPKQPKTQKLGQQGKQILRTYLSLTILETMHA